MGFLGRRGLQGLFGEGDGDEGLLFCSATTEECAEMSCGDGETGGGEKKGEGETRAWGKTREREENHSDGIALWCMGGRWSTDFGGEGANGGGIYRS